MTEAVYSQDAHDCGRVDKARDDLCRAAEEYEAVWLCLEDATDKRNVRNAQNRLLTASSKLRFAAADYARAKRETT